MHINSKDTISNIPILKVRDFLKRYNNDDIWSKSALSYKLDLSDRKANELIKSLLDLEYIEYSKTYRRKKYWKKYWNKTLKGSTFSLASAARPFLRATAKKQLSSFVERVNHVNSSSGFLQKVTKVVIFGSYLSDSQKHQ